MKHAIVIITGRKGEPPLETPFYHGVFADGDAATRWAGVNCDRAYEWHWEEISTQTDDNGVIELRA